MMLDVLPRNIYRQRDEVPKPQTTFRLETERRQINFNVVETLPLHSVEARTTPD